MDVRDFVIKDFRRNSQKDVNPAVPTMVFSDCRASRVILDGVASQQIETLQKSAGIQYEIVQQEAFSQDEIKFSYQYDIDQRGILQLTQSGFTTLSINNKE